MEQKPACLQGHVYDEMSRAITHHKSTCLGHLFWLAPLPLYVSQIRMRLNFGSALLKMHRTTDISGSHMHSGSWIEQIEVEIKAYCDDDTRVPNGYLERLTEMVP